MPRKDERTVRTAAAAARERSRSSDSAAQLQKLRSGADVDFVDALANVLIRHDLAEIELTREYGDNDELKVRLSRYAAPPPQAPMVAAPAMAAPAPALAPPPVDAGSDSGEAADPSMHPGAVASPMVGTVYLAPEPGAATYVSEGDQVSEGQTLLIVEAMKTMNQIPSPKAGVVKKILVENGQPVEFGAPLMIIE